MRKIYIAILFLSLFSCKNKKNIPDVSGIKADVAVERFDKDFFQVDTTNLEASLNRLQARYPAFLPLFIHNVLGIQRAEENNFSALKSFVRLNKSIYDAASIKYKNVSPTVQELQQAFKFVKYYFPSYKIPGVIFLVGPVDAMAEMENGDRSPNFLGPDFIGISLQFYLGGDYSIYQAGFFIDNVAPLYRSRRFDQEYIVADVMKLVADDLFPDKSKNKALIEQMIEKGKQWFLLDHFMPEAPDSIKTGYTREQLKWCKENEGLIWSYILQNENLYSIEPNVLQIYIGESPSTQAMPDASPGNIGQWLGWQIVKKYALNSPEQALPDIMRMEPKQILDGAKYKPK